MREKFNRRFEGENVNKEFELYDLHAEALIAHAEASTKNESNIQNAGTKES